jgi:ribosomal protein S18 acetylase RimI-like enzyme
VVERGGQLDGYALLTFPAGRAHARLYSLAVAPNVRGHGIGRRLLAAAETAAAKAGRATLRLEVRRDNAAARRLYRSRGFGEVGQRPDYYGDGCEALRLEKPLAPRGPSRG